MPIPRGVARFNRRVVNRITRPIVGWLPGFALLCHTGRRSGRTYRTPIMAFRGGDGYRIALTYGVETDWVRNVLAQPRIVNDPGRRWAPPVVRQVLGVIGATAYMQLTVVGDGAGSP